MCCSFFMTSNCPVKVAKRKSWRFWQLGGNRWQSWNRWARVLGFVVVVQEVMKAFGSGKKIHRSNLVLGLRIKNSMAFQGRQVSFESLFPLNFRAVPEHPVQFLLVGISNASVSVTQSFGCFSAHLAVLVFIYSNEPLVLGAGFGATVCSEWTAMALTLLILSTVEDSFSSNAVLSFSLFFRHEAPFLHANGKQWGHDGSWNLTFAIACVILLCLCKLQRESFQVL